MHQMMRMMVYFVTLNFVRRYCVFFLDFIHQVH